MKEPKLRFPEFTDEWEQRKLGSILTRRIEYKKQSKDYPRLAFASGQGVIPLSERKTNNREQLTKDEFTKKYLVTELDDIVYNPGNLKYGAIDRNKCQRGLISPIYVTFTVNEVPGFIERIVTSHNFQQRALRFEEGTVVKRQSVNPEDLINLDVFVAPQKEEQAKIGECFDVLDNLIQSAEKELEGYRELKQGMLQKMFPKKGKKVPEIRFPEFAGDWEQRKVSEMFKITRGYVLPATKTSEETNSEMPYPVYSSQTKNNGLMGYYSNYLYEDAITWTTDGANAGTVNYRAGKFYCTNVCGVLLSDKIEASKAIAEALNSVAKKHVSYVGNPKLMNNVMAEIQIAVPPTKEEQDKISSYFESLDNLITLQQKEIDGYKELKKGLLQQMFC